MSRRRWPTLLAVLGVTVATLAGCGGSGSATAPAATPHPSATAPSAGSGGYRFSLTLGDSLGFGYQGARAAAEIRAHRFSPAGFPGFAALVTAALRARNPGMTATNLSCPGETTTSFRTGPCAFQHSGLPLHTGYPGSQQAAAVSYLRSRRGQRGLVTVSLGANDVDALAAGCPTFTLSCLLPRLQPTLTRVGANLTASLRTLHAADPQAVLVALEPYNPFAVLAPITDTFAVTFDATIAAAARAAGAIGADAYPVFNPATGERATLCRLTAFCATRRDIHPTNAGYAALAAVILAALPGSARQGTVSR